MDIKILGYDCPHCNKLYQRAMQAVEQLRIRAMVEKVTVPEDVWSYGLVRPPTLVVDGHILSQGKLLTVDELRKLLKHILESSVMHESTL